MNKQQRNFIKKVRENTTLKMLFNPEICTVIACQAALESFYAESSLAKTNNNLFGMKEPQIRPTTSIGEKRGYANYTTQNASISDLAIWILWNKPTQDDLEFAMDYLLFIQRKKYAEDEGYTSKIIDIYNQYLKTQQNETY